MSISLWITGRALALTVRGIGFALGLSIRLTIDLAQILVRTARRLSLAGSTITCRWCGAPFETDAAYTCGVCKHTVGAGWIVGEDCQICGSPAPAAVSCAQCGAAIKTGV